MVADEHDGQPLVVQALRQGEGLTIGGALRVQSGACQPKSQMVVSSSMDLFFLRKRFKWHLEVPVCLAFSGRSPLRRGVRATDLKARPKYGSPCDHAEQPGAEEHH